MGFAPDGTFGGWRQSLARPAFWVVAIICLIIPLLRFGRRRLALAGWAFFWGISLLMALGSAVRW
jgi:hypothetical protein